MTARKAFDISGQRFGMLTVLARDGVMNGNAVFHVRCDCGGERWVQVRNLRSGKTSSCGCLRVAPRPKPKKAQPPSPVAHVEPPPTTVQGHWLDGDGVVLPEYRERVAALRKMERADDSELLHYAEARHT